MKLRKDQIHHLAFEGVGGKGAAYLGALGVMADPKVGLLKPANDGTTQGAVLDKTKVARISGASAGAITATLLACGYSLQEILQVVTSSELLKFYDPPRFYRPRIGKSRAISEFEEPSLAGRDGEEARKRFEVAKGIAHAVRVAASLIKQILSLIKIPIASFPTAFQTSIDSPEICERYVLSLLTDYGMYSGAGARRFFDDMIARKTIIGRTATHGVTFAQFLGTHQVDLQLVGTRLETGTAHYFSAVHTPDFRVADAVRISMSIPLLFKPVVIRKGDFPDDHDLVGTWVDGGLINNLPIHAFDDNDVISPHVLGVRLGVDGWTPIQSFGDFLGRLVDAALAGGEKGQIRTQQEQDQTLELPIGRLSTFEFSAPRDVINEAVKQSASATMAYFGLDQTTSSFLNKKFNITRR